MPTIVATPLSHHHLHRQDTSGTRATTGVANGNQQGKPKSGMDAMIKALSGQKRQMKRMLRNWSSDFNELQEEYDMLWREHQHLEHEHSVLTSGRAKVIDKLHEVQEKNVVLQQDLQHCKDDLFRLQPLNQTSDAEFLKHYETLLQRITSFIDDIFSQLDEQVELSERSDEAMLSQFVGGDGDPDGLIARFPSAAEYLMRREIIGHLQREVFDESVYLFRLPPGTAQMLKDLEESMGFLEPKRGMIQSANIIPESLDILIETDPTTIGNWRSETLAAFARMEGAAEYQRTRCGEVAVHLHEGLLKWFPAIGQLHGSLEELYRKIVISATNLAVSLQLAPSRFLLLPRLSGTPLQQRDMVFRHQMDKNSLIDVQTRKILNTNNPVISDNDGSIGRCITCVEPGLFRRSSGVDQYVGIRKPSFLVQLGTPLGEQVKGLKKNGNPQQQGLASSTTS